VKYPYLLFLTYIIITGCVSKVSTLEQDIDLQLDAETGYLLIGIETDANLEDILIIGERKIKLTGEDLSKGTQYILIDMPSGKYSINRIKMNFMWHTNLKEGYWDFDVSPGVVSYVGHINVDTRGRFRPISNVELENRSSEALVFMQKQYPNILGSRNLKYDGPGDDPFLEYVEKDGWK
jgi:hypothetical protein